MSALTTDKITEIFCIVDDFPQEFSIGDEKTPKTARTRQKAQESSMRILLFFHMGHFKNFKHFYLACIQVNLRNNFQTNCHTVVLFK
jgi:hypothetical protein